MKMLESLDWYGAQSQFRPRMSVRIESEILTFQFEAKKSPNCDLSLSLGDFQEGLWERDVAEFFVAGPGKRYQEINISPNGAWWSALFGDYRELEREIRFEPTISVQSQPQFWSVEFKVEVCQLLPWTGVEPDQWRFSPSAILYSPDPSYFCWHAAQAVEPDFHRSDLLRPLSLFHERL